MSDQPRGQVSRRAPIVPGSEAALGELRREIARLEVELDEIERRTAQVERDGLDGPPAPLGPRSRKMADELAAASIERERADMRRFLGGTSAVCEARVGEARSEARLVLSAARDELSRAVQERAVLVEEVIATPPLADGAAAAEPVEIEVPASAEGRAESMLTAGAGQLDAAAPIESAPAESAPVEPEPIESGVAPDAAAAASTVEAATVEVGRVATPASGRRAALISVLMWIVGGALVVVGLAFAIVVILMLLD